MRDLKGIQALYAITYQTRPEFYEMFDHEKYVLVCSPSLLIVFSMLLVHRYFELRQRYGAETLLPEIFDKVSVVARGEKTKMDHAKYPPRAASASSGSKSPRGRPRAASKSKKEEVVEEKPKRRTSKSPAPAKKQ